MGDMDEEELAVINKLQFDEKQKRLGLPQSHELVFLALNVFGCGVGRFHCTRLVVKVY